MPGRNTRLLIANLIMYFFLLASLSFAQESLNLLTTIPMPRDSVRVSSITPIRDFNADGYGDLAVGITGIDDHPVLEAVYVFFGGPSFDSIADLCFLPDTQSLYYCYPSYQRKTYFGMNVTPLGDFNGDGFDDFAISASQLCTYTIQNGRIYIYFGGPNPDTTADLKIDGRGGYDCMGSLLASGDFNGDGLGDLLAHAGDEYYGERMSIFLGGNTPDTSVDWVYSYPRADPPIMEVHAGFDLNNDGYGDFAWMRSTSDYLPLFFFLGGDTLSHQPYFRGNYYFHLLTFDLSGDGVDDFWGRVNGTSYLYLGGNPLDFEPDYPLGPLGAWPSIYHRAGYTNMFMVDDGSRLMMYDIVIPPETTPAFNIYYSPRHFYVNPNIGDINSDGSDELAFGSFMDDTLQQVKIYNITMTGINDNGNNNLPENISLSAYPNPFNGAVKITYRGPFDGGSSISIYSITGQIIRKFKMGGRKEGDYSIIWDATSAAGCKITSGIYIVEAGTSQHRITTKLLYLK